MVKNFDKIFWEVNQGYAADFLPFLLPFHTNRMKQLEKWSHEIRTFILENIINERYVTWNIGNEPNDYIESLIDHVKQKLQPRIEWETVNDIYKIFFFSENNFFFISLGALRTGRHNWRPFSGRKFPRQSSRIHRSKSSSSAKHSGGS